MPAPPVFGFLSQIVDVHWGRPYYAVALTYTWIGKESAGPSYEFDTPQGDLLGSPVFSQSNKVSRSRGPTVGTVTHYTYASYEPGGGFGDNLNGTITVTETDYPEGNKVFGWGFTGLAFSNVLNPVNVEGTGTVSDAVAYLSSTPFYGVVFSDSPSATFIDESSSSTPNSPIYTITGTVVYAFDIDALKKVVTDPAFEVDIITGKGPTPVVNVTTGYTWQITAASFQGTSKAALSRSPADWPAHKSAQVANGTESGSSEGGGASHTLVSTVNLKSLAVTLA